MAHWYRVTAFKNDEKIAEQAGKHAYLRQRFFDENGEQLLVAIRLEAEGIPQSGLRALVEAVTLTELSPTILFGPHADLVRLEALSDVESRREEAEYQRALREASEPPAEPPADGKGNGDGPPQA
jgi:hypothetical protein